MQLVFHVKKYHTPMRGVINILTKLQNKHNFPKENHGKMIYKKYLRLIDYFIVRHFNISVKYK